MNERNVITWAEDIGFFEGNFAGDVNVEEVRFAVGAEEGAVGVECEACIVELWLLLRGRCAVGGRGGRGAVFFGNGPPDEVDFVFGSHGGEGVVGG